MVVEKRSPPPGLPGSRTARTPGGTPRRRPSVLSFRRQLLRGGVRELLLRAGGQRRCGARAGRRPRELRCGWRGWGLGAHPERTQAREHWRLRQRGGRALPAPGLSPLSPQDLDEDDFDVGKPKKQRRSIVRAASMTRVGDSAFLLLGKGGRSARGRQVVEPREGQEVRRLCWASGTPVS